MIIKFKNLGPIESGEIDFNDLKGINLIIGKNNTGKTYLSNLLYAYFKTRIIPQRNIKLNLKELVEKTKIIGFSSELSISVFEEIKNKYEVEYENKVKSLLPKIFHASQEKFKNFEITIDLENEINEFKKSNGKLEVFFKDINKIIKLIKNKNEVKFLIEDFEENNKDIFHGLKYNRKITLEKAKEIIFETLIYYKMKPKNYNFYSFPAERSGAILFYKQLLEGRNDKLREMEIEFEMENFENEISRYSEPVNDYIKFLNSIDDILGYTELYNENSFVFESILDGNIKLEEKGNIIFEIKEREELDMGLVSSTVKTLAGFFLYLKYQAQKGDIIFIDEIELNLHPENQRKIMKLINYLSKQGLKFIISTHSPIITEEIDNMLLFEKVKDRINKEEMEEYGLNEEYGLKSSDISVFHLHNKTVEKIKAKDGEFEIETFNSVLEETDNLYQTLLFYTEGNNFGE